MKKSAASKVQVAMQEKNISTEAKTRSKFSKRFNMTGSGMTQADESGMGNRSTLGTPSTSAASMQSPGAGNNKDAAPLNPNIQDTKGDMN